MPKHLALAALLAMSALPFDPGSVLAQAPGLPGAPQTTPNYPGAPRLPVGPQGGSGSFEISAAANDHGAFLWVVDNVQHAVVLCERTDGGRDFTCSKKPLP